MNEAMRAVRDAFQEKHPHYTPPPWAGERAWRRWISANVRLHGWDSEHGFKARFPRHAALIENPAGSLEMMLFALRDFSYPNGWQS